MSLENLKIGLGITGSFCNFSETKNVICDLKKENVDVLTIISFTTRDYDTRFYKKSEYIKMLEEETKNRVIDTIPKAEPIGPKNMVDVILICPCTGNTLAKLAHGITDSPVTMATKATLRNGSPIVIGVSTNDGLGINGENIMKLLNTKNVYFIPFGQDNCVTKPNSLISHFDMLIPTINEALANKQIQPVLKEYKKK